MNDQVERVAAALNMANLELKGWSFDYDITGLAQAAINAVLCDQFLHKIKAALDFYEGEAEALARYMAEGKENKTDAIMASITVLSLDAGRRAREALSELKDK